MLQRLDRLGRFKIDPMNSGIDWSGVLQDCIAAFHERARADPDEFLAGLLLVVEQDRGGFATYGASTLIHELVPESANSEVGRALLDRAIDFNRRRDVPLALWTGYEIERWFDR